MRRLLPDPGPTTVEEQLDSYRPWEMAGEERPFVAMNFAVTVDGRATIAGVSGPIGSDADTAMLVGLRTRFDAVMIGAGTMRAERYGSLPGERLMVIVSGSLELPWDAALFTEGRARPGLHQLRRRATGHGDLPGGGPPRGRGRPRGGAAPPARGARGRAVLSEGGPRLHAEMQALGLVDELFLTTSPKLAGGAAPRILEGELPELEPLELAWLLEEDGELFARYRRAR